MFSLKWKALLAMSVVLLLLVAAFSVSIEATLDGQFERQQRLVDHARIEALNGLVENAKAALLRMASVSDSVQGMATALSSQDAAAISSAFSVPWSELELEAGLVEAAFFSNDDRLLARFGTPDESVITKQQVRSWVKEVQRTERPVTDLLCASDCRLYAVAPLLVDGRQIGAVMFASPLSDVVSSFYQVTNTDIALLLRERADKARTDPLLVPQWRMAVPMITSSRLRYPLLLDAARDYTLEALQTGAVKQFGPAQFRIIAVPVSRFAPAGSARWLLIDDVTEAMAEIRAVINRNWIYGICGLAIAECVLALLLWRPLSRLRATAETLPLLGQSAFELTRSIIGTRRARGRSLFADESDLLDDTATSLSHRLEFLEQTVTSRTERLRSQAHQLRQDRDFIQRLLDTAQAVILTQDRDGRVLSLNAFGSQLLRVRADVHEVVWNFDDAMGAKAGRETIRRALNEVADGTRSTFQHDAAMRVSDGEWRDIAWRHSRLHIGSEQPAILSVGLDVSEQRKAEREIAWLADHDPLTNLFNRRRFQRELERTLTEAAQYDHTGSLLYLDLDQFKFINDSGGHAVGDALLKAVARTVRKAVRSTDIVSRLGGDEFAILLPQTDQVGATTLAEKIRTALRALHVEVGGRPHRVTTSIGVACYPEHGIDVHDLLAIADLAMYQAKAGGRDQWQLYSAETMGRDFMRGVLTTKTMIEEALAEHRFELHYQPIMDLRSGAVSHVEALLRLRLPSGELVPPDEFISVAERTGAIREIDKSVLRLAAVEIEQFVDAGFDLKVSVNQSAYAFGDPGFSSGLAQMMTEHPSVSGRLILEITESAAVMDVTATNEIFRTVQELGCQLAIDDFGTGFSSLKYLKQLRVDYIKIDGVFVRELVDNPDDQVLTLAVVELAHMFDMKTIAEHVGRQDVCEWLRTHGVDLAQGYLIGRPLPRAEFVERFCQGVKAASVR
ncbi:MAG: EAL domain-containing protein [Thiohalocapsa sp.]|nr:EAL domain-containing protein [Thiohalocapsa sp.]